MRKFLLIGVTLAALVAPSVASADQPTDPGCFGQTRSANIAKFFTNDGYGNWGQWIDGPAARAGTNGENNAAYKATYCS